MLQAVLMLIGCAGSQHAETQPVEIRQADVAALKAAMAEPVVLVDVRTPGEFSGGHVPGAVSIPLNELPARMDELRPHAGQDIWLICHSGGRSMTAAGLLVDAGLSPVNVEGGTAAWKAAGNPVE